MRLSRLPRSWRAVVDLRLAPLGLTQTRWITLYSLWKCGNGQAQCDLARTVGVEAPSLVRTLDQLADQGLVERRPCGQDRRTKRIHLTEQAAPLIEQIVCVVNEARAEMLQGLSEADIRHLSAILEVIEQNSQRLLEPREQGA